MKKRCTKCDRRLSTSEFYRNKKSADGLQSWCKRCIGENKERHRATPEVRWLCDTHHRQEHAA